MQFASLPTCVTIPPTLTYLSLFYFAVPMVSIIIIKTFNSLSMNMNNELHLNVFASLERSDTKAPLALSA